MTQLIAMLVLLVASAYSLAQEAKSLSEKSEMLYRRGLSAYQAGDFSSAASFFEQTLENSYSPNAAVYLTYIRKETGDFRGALQSLQTYLDNTGDQDPELQSYISLKLFLEARLAAQLNQEKLANSRNLALAATGVAVVALIISVIALRKK